MIDWNTELNNTIAKYEKKRADLKAKKEQKRLEKEQAERDYIEYCKVFDKVIQEEIEGVKALLDNYKDRFTYTITITSGNVLFELEAMPKEYIGFLHETNFSCMYCKDIDLETYTRQRLSDLITFFILNLWGGVYY